MFFSFYDTEYFPYLDTFYMLFIICIKGLRQGNSKNTLILLWYYLKKKTFKNYGTHRQKHSIIIVIRFIRKNIYIHIHTLWK